MFSAAVAGTLLCVSANAVAHGPVALTDGQLDQVTAGLALNLSTVAVALNGNFVSTETGGGGASGQTALPGGGSVASGVVGGTASAISSGGTVGTSVDTSGSVPGIQFVNKTVNGTVTSPVGQVTVGFTYVSGGTTFLP